MWISETNPDYTAQSIARRMRFYFQGELVGEYEVGIAERQKKVLECWAQLKLSPGRILTVPDILDDYIGCQIADLSIADDGETLLIQGKEAGVI